MLVSVHRAGEERCVLAGVCMVRNTVSVNSKAAFKPPAPLTLASVCGVRSLQDMGMGKGAFKCDHPDNGDEHSNFGGDNVRVHTAAQSTASGKFFHAQTYENVRVHSASQAIASVHIFYTCPNLSCRPCSQW